MTDILVKGETMKRNFNRSVAVVAVVAALGVSIPSVAFADSLTTSSSATATPTAWTTWHATWVTYVQGLKSINVAYRSSMFSARRALWAAIAPPATKTDRQAAFATFETAVQAAINTRVAAITGAGTPPPPPAGYNGTNFVTGFQSANIAFRASVVAAQTALSLALTGATPQEARTARLTYEQSLGSAITARSTALLALGTPPTKPGQPSS
jgi:hypothetical protein